jgi:hypothetical protein
MKGWKTRTFTEEICIHHRKIGTGKSTLLAMRFRFGKQDYYLGGHPLWEAFRSLYQMKTKPYILGGLFLFSGYLRAAFSSRACRVSSEGVDAQTKEPVLQQTGDLWVTDLLTFQILSASLMPAVYNVGAGTL